MRGEVEPEVGGVPRRTWRVRVERSRLPAGVKLTLLKHASLSRRHFHDDIANEHAISRIRLARSLGVDERTVSRHLARAEDEGWLVRHRNGHNGREQSVFHYLTPQQTCRCTDTECLRRAASRETRRATSRETPTASNVGRQECPPYVVTYRHNRDAMPVSVDGGPHLLRCDPGQAAWTNEMGTGLGQHLGQPPSTPPANHLRVIDGWAS